MMLSSNSYVNLRNLYFAVSKKTTLFSHIISCRVVNDLFVYKKFKLILKFGNILKDYHFGFSDNKFLLSPPIF